MSSCSLGDPFLCTGLRCVLGLQHSEGTLPPQAPVSWQELLPTPAGLETQGTSPVSSWDSSENLP